MCLALRLGLLCLLICLASPAFAEMTLVEDFEAPAVDGTIWCVQEFENELVVGGLFQGLGRQRISTLASWDGARWRSLGLEEIVQDRVYAMTVFEGDLVVAISANWSEEPWEYWESFFGTHRVLRLTEQGWVQLGDDLRHQPRALAVHQGELFVGLQSSITTRGEHPVHRFFDGAWQPAGLPPGEVFVSIHALVSDGQTLFVGGSFEGPDVPGESRPAGFPRGVYAWVDGVWSLVGDGLSSDRAALARSYPMGRQGVHDLALYGGHLYATGSFVNETEMYAGFARFDGTVWEALPSIGVGYQLTELDEGLVVTGVIAHEIDGEHRYDLAVFDGSSWSDLDPGPEVNPVATAAGTWEGQLVLARDGTLPPWYAAADVGHGPGLTFFGGDRWSSPIPGEAPGGLVEALFEFEGDLLVGGPFEFAGAQPAGGVARWIDGEWESVGAGLFGGEGVKAFTTYEGMLVAGGEFFAPAEGQFTGVAFWDGAEWHSRTPTESAGSIDGHVKCMTAYGDQLWVGGSFDAFDGEPASGLAWFDGEQWAAVPVEGVWQEVRTLEVYQGQLIVGGRFDHVGGIAANGLARFDGSGWSEIKSSARGPVQSLEVFEGFLYVSRLEDYWYGGSGEEGLFAWDGVDSLHPVRDPDLDDYFLSRNVLEMHAENGRLHMITSAPGIEPADLVTWDGQRVVGRQRWQLWGEGLRRWVPRALATVGPDLYMGGVWNFGGDPAPRALARLDPGTSVSLPAVELQARTVSGGVLLQWSLERMPLIEGIALEHAQGGRPWSRIREQGPDDAQQWTHRTATAGFHDYRMVVSTSSGSVVSGTVRVEISTPRVARTRITEVSPNPFNPRTGVRFELAEPGAVTVSVYDVAGRLVRTLRDEVLAVGEYLVHWDGEDTRGRGVASGVYLVVLQSSSGRDSRRVALIR